MTKPVLSVEMEGQMTILRLRNSPEAVYVVEKALRHRATPGLQSDLSNIDLGKFKETVGSVSVALQLL
jgi:Fe-S cluster biogenesis protein NfuA